MFVVQRWYSGMFGVETLSWWDSHSAVEIWKNNKNMLKRKYRMHNLYVQVSTIFQILILVKIMINMILSREYQKISSSFGTSKMAGNQFADF